MTFERAVEQQEKRFSPLQPQSVSRPLTHQIVTLAFLSKALPASLISEQIARSVCVETGASVVLVRLQACEGAPPSFIGYNGQATAVDWAPAEVMLQGQFLMPSSLLKTEDGFHLLTLSVSSGLPSPQNIASLVSQLSRHFRHVLVEAVAVEKPTPALQEFLLHSDLAYLFFQPAAPDVFRLDQVLQQLRPLCENNGQHLKPIACLAEGEQIDGFDALVERIANPVHMFVRRCPIQLPSAPGAVQVSPAACFKADVRRLAREIGGCLVGLALSSGAAKGFAHIGVIQVLEENGIEVDVVAGASIGAYIGALWTYGFDGQHLEKLARELESRWGFWSLIDPIFPPRQGFLRGVALKRRLKRSIGNARFADLARPLRIVAGNLATVDRMVFASGEVAAAVHASMAVPGICVPVTIDGETYIDGGIVDPLPVEVLRDMGVARVIAVNAIPSPERIRYALQAERELARTKEQPVRKLFRKVLPIDQQLNYFARGNLFEIVMRSVHGAQVRLAEASCRLADVVLRPDICDDRWLDCRNPGRFIRLGREAAERHLEQIKALGGRNKENHEYQLAPQSVAAVA